MQDILQHKSSALSLLEGFLAAAPEDAAKMLETLPLSEAVFWVSSLKAQSVILVLENMTYKKAAVLLRRLPFKQASYVAAGLNAARAAELLSELPPYFKQKLVDNAEPSLKKALENVLSYPQGSAACAMHGGYFAFKTDIKIKDITARLKALPRHKLPPSVYIIDKTGRLGGIIKTAELAFYSPAAVAGSVMTVDFDKLSPAQNLGSAFDIFKRSGLPLLPVVDADGFLIGVLPFFAAAKNTALPRCMPRGGKELIKNLLKGLLYENKSKKAAS
jgi:magnesium transporter